MMKQAWVGVILACGAALGAASAQNNSQPPASANPPLPPLEQLLAPVALYPDPLLAQVLTSATSPGQVTEMNNWLQQNKNLQGTALQEAAQQKGFDASFIALALFPDVMNQLASQIDWTTELGTAFLSDPTGVMNAVQKLRAQAQAAGNLTSTPQQQVTTENQGGQQVIVIQPANPQVVYVPVYNPTVVYYPPPPSAVLIGFGLGIAIGAAMSNSSYYYSPWGWGAWGMGWHSHTVVVRGGAWVVPPYARYPYVRPIAVPYGGYYRPRPYAYSSTTVNINRVTVNNPGYRGGVTPRPTPYQPVARPATPLPATSPGTRPGTNPGNAGQRPTTLPSAGNTPATRPATGSGARSGTQPTTPTQGKPDYGSRGYNAPNNVRPTERAQTSSSAFTGYQNGSAERAASQRGQGSASRSQGSAPRGGSAPRTQGRKP
jgi:hypothetical protein